MAKKSNSLKARQARTHAGEKGREKQPGLRLSSGAKPRVGNHSSAAEIAGLHPMKIRRIKIADIVVDDDQKRDIKPVDVLAKADSMSTIGLKTPITVRKVKGRIHLIAGLERVEAAKLLGWKEIDAAFFKGGKIPARMWHHLENLDHSDKFTPLEKAERLAEVVALKAKLISRQIVEKKRGRPIGIISRVLSTLPIKGKTAKARIRKVERTLKVARLADKVKAEAKARGLDKKETALLDIAKEKTPEAQLQKIDEIVKRNAKKQADRDRVKKAKARQADHGRKGEERPQHLPDDVVLAELRSQCRADLRKTWAKANTKVKRQFLREELKWEGGNPLSNKTDDHSGGAPQ